MFWDDDLEPGEEWFKQLKTEIDASPKLFVMWCYHASASEQVQREFEYALALKKTVIPVLLDNTPLPPQLRVLHGIDLRGTIAHRETAAVALAPDFQAGNIVIAIPAGSLTATGLSPETVVEALPPQHSAKSTNARPLLFSFFTRGRESLVQALFRYALSDEVDLIGDFRVRISALSRIPNIND